MFVQPRHLPQGLDRGHPAQHALGAWTGRFRRSTTTCGSSTTRTSDWTQAHDLAEGEAGEAARAAAAVPDRGGQVQRAAARRPPRRALQRRPRRPPAARSAATPSCCSAAWDGSARTRSSTIKNKSLLGHRGRRRAGGRRRTGVIIAQGGSVRRLEPVRSRTASRSTATTCSASSLLRRGRPADARRAAPGAHGVHLRRRRPRQGRRPSRCTSTATRSARAASRAPSRCSSRRTRRPTSATRRGTPVSDDYTAESSRFTGTINWVQIDTRRRRPRPPHQRPRSGCASRWPGSRGVG